jgi:hypothetical protein
MDKLHIGLIVAVLFGVLSIYTYINMEEEE